jgi:aryl-alcohol dehydrogenase-like predicted oxidoreductase
VKRRDFLTSTVVGSVVPAVALAQSKGNPIPKRPYRDNVQLSVIGYGGIVLVGMDPKQAADSVARSFDRGVNYYDVAPSYWDGEAEIKLGVALEPYRKRSFLACKTGRRDAAGAGEELERSLQRLKTDYFDLYQFHAVTSKEDVEQILGPKGAAETFVKARKEGKVKYLGMSAHSVEAAYGIMDAMQLDSILFPVNYTCFGEGGFGPQILEKAKQKGVARLALKALAKQAWPQGTDRSATGHPKCWYEPIADRETARQALAFTLSEDITSAIPPGDEAIYEMALDLARDFKPLTPAARQKLLASAKGLTPIFRAART